MILEGSENVLFFKFLMKMKINQKFAKKAVLAASLTAGVIGFNSMFSEAQATGKSMSCVTVQSTPYQRTTTCTGAGSACSTVKDC